MCRQTQWLPKNPGRNTAFEIVIHNSGIYYKGKYEALREEAIRSFE